MMEQIHALHSASITELKKNPNAILAGSNGEAVAILNHNKPMAYLIPARQYEKLLMILEDHNLNEIADQRMDDGSDLVEVDIDDL